MGLLFVVVMVFWLNGCFWRTHKSSLVHERASAEPQAQVVDDAGAVAGQ
jgi:hypothetical protein